MQVILCSSFKISMTPESVGKPACDVARYCNTVTAGQQWKPAEAQFEEAAAEENVRGFFCCVHYREKCEHWAGLLSKPSSFIANPSDIAWYINQDCLQQGLDLFLFCSCITVLLQAALEIF